MSKLFSRFGKSPNSQATLSPQHALGDSPVRTGSIDSPHPRKAPPSPSPLRDSAHPKVILTSETSDATTPTSPGSIHRQSSIGTSIEDAPRKSSLPAAQRQAFADQMSRSNNASIAEDLQTPRAAPETPRETPATSTPKANGLRASPSSEFKPPQLQPSPLQDSPSIRKQTSAASLAAPPASRSRRGSAASSDAGSTTGKINAQMANSLAAAPLVESPTSEKPIYASPRSSLDGHGGPRSPTRSVGKAKAKTRTWRNRGNSGGGGIAGALAQSGMSLAMNPGLAAAAPPLPPLPVKQPTRGASILPHSPSEASVGYTGGGAPLAKTTSRVSRGSRSRAGNESSDSDAYDSEDALSFGPDEIPITGFAVASSKRNIEFHELFPNVPSDDYLIEDYGCALQREILVQGRLYISENHMCFNANIFGWITNFIVPFSDVTGLEKKMTAYVIPNAIQICTRTAKYTFASFLSRDTTYDVMNNIWRISHPRSAGPESSVDLRSPEAALSGGGGATTTAHRPTQCACSKEGKHYDTLVMDIVLPGAPEKIYNLLFASGFSKDFMAGEQKLLDIQISEWHPEQSGSQLLTRNVSYIKPLSGSIGPKQTKCELKDETLHVDFDDYVSTLTTTRTPDVPSGNVFAVKTRTCIMWAGAAASRIIVTTTVEWTGRSFIKSIIDKSCVDGQKQYHTDLEKAMRNYIAAHRTEFVPEDVGEDAAAAIDDAIAAGDTTISPDNTPSKVEPESHGLQRWLDMLTSVSEVAKDSFWGAVDLAGEMPGTALLGAVIAVLLITNIWTMLSLRSARGRVDVGPARAGVDTNEVLKVLLEEVVRGRRAQEQVVTGESDPLAEAAALKKSVEAIEARVERLKKSLAELD